MVKLHGLMVNITKANGLMENKMVLAIIQKVVVLLEKHYGKMEGKLNGLMKMMMTNNLAHMMIKNLVSKLRLKVKKTIIEMLIVAIDFNILQIFGTIIKLTIIILQLIYCQMKD